jgi:hypothetical protein
MQLPSSSQVRASGGFATALWPPASSATSSTPASSRVNDRAMCFLRGRRDRTPAMEAAIVPGVEGSREHVTHPMQTRDRETRSMEM